MNRTADQCHDAGFVAQPLPHRLHANGSVTLRTIHNVRPEQVSAFEEAVAALPAMGEITKGWLGADVVEPAPGTGSDEWQVLLRFETEADLTAWHAAPATQQWCNRLAALTTGKGQSQRLHGLDVWFTLPDATALAPPKWKMVIITSFVIYPLLFIVPALLVLLIGNQPKWLATLLNVVVTIPLMTWVVMPIVTKALANWLRKDHPRSPQPVTEGLADHLPPARSDAT